MTVETQQCNTINRGSNNNNNNKMATSSSGAISKPQLQAKPQVKAKPAGNESKPRLHQKQYHCQLQMTVETQQCNSKITTKWRRRPEQSNNPNCRQRHPSNKLIKPEAAQTTTPWSNAKESHNNNKRKQYCKEEAAILAMTTTKTNKRPIRIKNSPATTEQAITYNPQAYNNTQKQQPTFKCH